MANYSNAFSPSFKSNTFITKSIPGITDVASKGINLSNINFNAVKDIKFNPSAFTSGLDLVGGGGWTFITAPGDVSWDVANAASRIDMFGTNNPPVVAGSRGMRDLSLGNALVEGFVRGVTVEGKISALEKLLNYSLNASDGFVSVPVYQVWANNKSYGGSEAYYIIKDVKVKEEMRDLTGNTTRAYVDISFMQVPSYQVGSGRDLASAKTAAAGSRILITQRQLFDAQRGVAGQAAQGISKAAGTTAGAAAGGVAKTAKPAKAPPPLNPNQAPVIRPAPAPPPQSDGSP